MRKLIYIAIVCLCHACDSENATDCFQKAGAIITAEFTVGSFNKIRIEENVSLVIRQGKVREVLVETGENLINEVTAVIEGDVLVIRDANNCNYVRDFGITKAIVTTPELVEIRNSSSFDVVGEGVLGFPFLRLISNTTGGITDSRKSGDFTMTINCEDFRVGANGFSAFYIDGFTDKARISLEDEIPLFEGANLIINDLLVLQRSANKMVVNPQQRLRGEIRGTGNIISVNRPKIIDVEEFYTGRLIFQD